MNTKKQQQAAKDDDVMAVLRFLDTVEEAIQYARADAKAARDAAKTKTALIGMIDAHAAAEQRGDRQEMAKIERKYTDRLFAFRCREAERARAIYEMYDGLGVKAAMNAEECAGREDARERALTTAARLIGVYLANFSIWAARRRVDLLGEFGDCKNGAEFFASAKDEETGAPADLSFAIDRALRLAGVTAGRLTAREN